MHPSQRDPASFIRVSGCLVVTLLLFTACLLPFLFVNFANAALVKLHLSPPAAILLLLGMLFGSVVNLPVARIPMDQEVVVPVFEPAAGWPVFPQFRRARQEMLVSVNLGGCVIPVLLAVWLLKPIVSGGPAVLTVLGIGIALNTAVCYLMARPIPNVGIAMSPFVPPLAALAVTWIGLAHERYDMFRAPVAYVIGISGPLLGADLLHWRDFRRIGAGMVSIGGMGTWDGIVLSGLFAAFFA